VLQFYDVPAEFIRPAYLQAVCYTPSTSRSAVAEQKFSPSAC